MPAPPEVVEIAERIAKKYGDGKCLRCAEALRRAFKRSGVQGYLVELKANGGSDYISMTDKKHKLPFEMPPGKDCISENGLHYGVVVGNYVFDNIFRSGTPLAGWRAQFSCHAQSFTERKFKKF